MTKILQFMMSKKGLPIVGLLLLCGLFFAFKSNGSGDDNSPARQEKILRWVATLLKEKHYSPKNINDAFSKAFVIASSAASAGITSTPSRSP